MRWSKRWLREVWDRCRFRPWLQPLLFCLAFGAGAQPTPQQRAWIAAHPVIRVAFDPSYPPVEFLDSKGQPVGLAPDYLHWVARHMGLKVERVPAKTWEEALELVRTRKADVVTNATPLPERASYLAFSRAWIELPDAILTRNDRPWIGDQNALAGKRVAVIKGYSSRAYLAAQQPTAILIEVPDNESALKEVSFGTVDAAVGDLASTSWLIDQRGITNLRVSGVVGSPTGVTLACRSDWPELRDILDAGLAAMPDDTRRAFQHKWISLAPGRWRPSPRFWAILSLSAALALVGMVLAWNRSLRDQVASRTRELERELAERTRIQEEKDQFVAMVTHELRTPLTSLQGALDLLSTTDGEIQRQRFLRMAQENCLRLIRITNDILDHEKLISRRMALRVERVDPYLVLHQSVEINRTYAEPLGVELVLEVPTSPLPAVLGDPDRLIQVATNLISNAAKWSRRGSRVEIRASLVQEGVQVEVVDHGAGIPLDFRDRLFRPYEQSHTLPDPSIKGTGLGLAICQILLEHHGAKLEFQSEEGVGTTFFFTLRLAG